MLYRLDYCNAVLYKTQATNDIQNQQGVKSSAARIILQSMRRQSAKLLLKHLNWLPVCQHIHSRLTTVTFKVQTTSAPNYLSQHIGRHESTPTLWSSAAPLLYQPWSTAFSSLSAFSTTRLLLSETFLIVKTAAPTHWLNSEVFSTLSLFVNRLLR